MYINALVSCIAALLEVTGQNITRGGTASRALTQFADHQSRGTKVVVSHGRARAVEQRHGGAVGGCSIDTYAASEQKAHAVAQRRTPRLNARVARVRRGSIAHARASARASYSSLHVGPAAARARPRAPSCATYVAHASRSLVSCCHAATGDARRPRALLNSVGYLSS